MKSPIPTRSTSSRRAAALSVVLCAVVVAAAGSAGAMPPPEPLSVGASELDERARPIRHVDTVLVPHIGVVDAEPPERESAAPVPTPPEVAVAVALDQVGKPYRTGAKGPDRFDCSGLTGFAWAAAGVPLPPSSRTQYAGLPKVDFDELQPGDLVFRGSPIHHVGVYIGDGQYVHSPRSGETVRVEAFDPARHVGAARPWVT